MGSGESSPMDLGEAKRSRSPSAASPGDPLVSFPSLGKKLAPQGETLPPPAGGEIPLQKTRKRSHPVIGTRASGSLRGATQFQSGRAAPSLTPCCGGGAAPVSRPAGGAVFGRVRLRRVLSTWGRSPWDLSLSGGIPVTHAPSWR